MRSDRDSWDIVNTYWACSLSGPSGSEESGREQTRLLGGRKPHSLSGRSVGQSDDGVWHVSTYLSYTHTFTLYLQVLLLELGPQLIRHFPKVAPLLED
jgi:hypothetical protein